MRENVTFTIEYVDGLGYAVGYEYVNSLGGMNGDVVDYFDSYVEAVQYLADHVVELARMISSTETP